MKTVHSIGINTYYRTAHLFIEEGHWIYFLIEWFAELLWWPISYCRFLERVTWKSDDGEYNEDLYSTMFHILLNKVTNWRVDHMKHRFNLTLNYDEVIKMPFYAEQHEEAVADNHFFENDIKVSTFLNDHNVVEYILTAPVTGVQMICANNRINRAKLKEASVAKLG